MTSDLDIYRTAKLLIGQHGLRGASDHAADRIDATFDYRAISKRVDAYVRASKFQLIETMAEKVAALIREEFDVPWVKVSVHKPWAVRGAQDVGITIERGER